ncbi:ORF14 [Betabaculovirus altermyunipunctae]|uniref:ORF14 n=1 Tax=Betabaculovirus altermyunipunctae TaxID=3051996 RepID=A0A1S5YDW0_9BBAC|nr:ORF14 [Betabaculovirus altermyunipunctae]AQQ80281.1 ORF14 [Betabaculovirus altermyunipunctae]
MDVKSPWSVVQEFFFLKYYCALPDDLAVLPVTVETILLLNLTAKTLLELAEQDANGFVIYERCVADVRVKCYQACVVIEEMGASFCLGKLIAQPVHRMSDSFNYDVACCTDLLLCTDVIDETVANIIKLSEAIRHSKEYAARLYQACASNPHDCAVCGSRHTMTTECGHHFCYECFVKASDVKVECPVCRNATKFRYKRDNAPADLLDTVRSHYRDQELTWRKK